MLREGGNAVDAAVAAVLMSFVRESPLTAPGAGGFMLVHTASGENHLLDFFVAAPGIARTEVPARRSSSRSRCDFSQEAIQVFNVGPSSCGVYGTPLGLCEALERFGSVALADLVERPARAAREGVELTRSAGVPPSGSSARSSARRPRARRSTSPRADRLRAGERLHLPELGDLLERLGAEGPGFLYRGDVAGEVSDWILERGGLLTREDLASYEVIERVSGPGASTAGATCSPTRRRRRAAS